jgi:hypothetical protein
MSHYKTYIESGRKAPEPTGDSKGFTKTTLIYFSFNETIYNETIC